jgi:predicted RNA polymerase sigma factor
MQMQVSTMKLTARMLRTIPAYLNEKKTAKQVAMEQGVTESAIRQRVARARRQIRAFGIPTPPKPRGKHRVRLIHLSVAEAVLN